MSFSCEVIDCGFVKIKAFSPKTEIGMFLCISPYRLSKHTVPDVRTYIHQGFSRGGERLGVVPQSIYTHYFSIRMS